MDLTKSEQYKLQGNTEFKKQKYQEAVDEFTKAIQCNNQDSNTFLLRAQCLLALKQYQKCIDDADQVLNLENSKNRKAIILKGQSLVQLGRFDMAITLFEQAIAIQSDLNLIIDLNGAKTLCQQQKDLDNLMKEEKYIEASQIVNLILQVLPNLQSIQMIQIEILVKLGLTKNAKEFFLKYQQSWENAVPEILYIAGLIELNCGTLEKAKEYFKESIQLDPENKKSVNALKKLSKTEEIKEKIEDDQTNLNQLQLNHYQNSSNVNSSPPEMPENDDLKVKFEWMPCNFYIRQKEVSKTIVWNFKQTIQLGNPKDNTAIPEVNVKIAMDRPFIYDEQIGWNWHKSWILPAISVKLEIIDSITKEIFDPPNQLFAKAYAVKAFTKEIENFHLIDIGFKGSDQILIEQNGIAQFSALKFSSTSYNNDGDKFNIVIAIISEDPSSNHPKILDAQISPPIFVDSRKSARENQNLKHSRLNTFFELFHPEQLEKTMCKRNKKKTEAIQEDISNDFKGLINYFTAPNIRNKIKHPLYLAFKFNKCVSIFYNTMIFMSDDPNYIIPQIMQRLADQLNNIQVKNSKSIYTKFNNNSLITILITVLSENAGYVSKKISDLLGYVDNSVINITFDPKEISERFKPLLVSTSRISEIYNFNYPKIIDKKCYNFHQNYNDESNFDSIRKKRNVQDNFGHIIQNAPVYQCDYPINTFPSVIYPFGFNMVNTNYYQDQLMTMYAQQNMNNYMQQQVKNEEIQNEN